MAPISSSIRVAAGTTLLAVVLAVLLGATAHAATPPNPFVGLVSEDAFNGSPHYRTTVVGRIAATGTGTMRQTMDWALIEPRRGRLDWRRYDAWVAATARKGVRVVPILFNPPNWASSRPKRRALRGTYPPKRDKDFAAFAARAVRRYGPGGSFWRTHRSIPALPITTWQVWNEPNLPVYWQPKPNAKDYVALLRATNAAIKRVDPAAQVLTGGLPQSTQGIPLETFVRQMYAAGAADAFDALAVNPYATTSDGVVAVVRRARKVMDERGDTDGLLWATEIGWSDNGPGGRFRLGSKGQALAISATFTKLWSERVALRLQGVIYFNWRDSRPYAGGGDFWGLHTGLLTLRNRAKPAYSAFRTAVAGLR